MNIDGKPIELNTDELYSQSLFLKRFITKQKKNKFDSCNEIWSVFWRKKNKIKNFN